MDPVLDTVPSRSAAESAARGSSAQLRPLWAAIGVLGLAVVALGGTLVYQHTRGTPMATVPLAVPSTAPAAPLVTAPPPVAARQEVIEEKALPAPVPSRPVVQAPRALAPGGNPPVTAPAYAPQAGAAPQGTYSTAPVVVAPVCTVCGRVESVTPVRRAAPATGVGAVAGGVLGAVVGNQFGHGSGRTVATLLGAGGGAYLGNTVEQRARTETVYVVHVRMDNGTRRSFERAEPVPVGELVTVEGHGFRLGRGATYSTAPDPRQAPYRQVAEPQQGVYGTR